MSLRTLSAATALILTLTISSTPAFASTSTPPEVPVACTLGGVPLADSDAAPTEIPTVMSCFDSVQEAERFIKNGAPGDYERLAPNRELATAAAASTVTIGKVWTGRSRTGSVLIHWGTGTGCYGVTYGFPTLTSSWNDSIRSAEGFSNCWSSQYDGANYSGSVLTCAPYCSTLGSMAAKTSSIVYRPVGTFG